MSSSATRPSTSSTNRPSAPGFSSRSRSSLQPRQQIHSCHPKKSRRRAGVRRKQGAWGPRGTDRIEQVGSRVPLLVFDGTCPVARVCVESVALTAAHTCSSCWSPPRTSWFEEAAAACSAAASASRSAGEGGAGLWAGAPAGNLRGIHASQPASQPEPRQQQQALTSGTVPQLESQAGQAGCQRCCAPAKLPRESCVS
jgi:hypothetical protein